MNLFYWIYAHTYVRLSICCCFTGFMPIVTFVHQSAVVLLDICPYFPSSIHLLLFYWIHAHTYLCPPICCNFTGYMPILSFVHPSAVILLDSRPYLPSSPGEQDLKALQQSEKNVASEGRKAGDDEKKVNFYICDPLPPTPYVYIATKHGAKFQCLIPCLSLPVSLCLPLSASICFSLPISAPTSNCACMLWE